MSRNVSDLAEKTESHDKTNNLRTVYRILTKLCRKSTSQVSFARTADESRTCWAEYLQHLYTDDPLVFRWRQVTTKEDTTPSAAEVGEAVGRSEAGKAGGSYRRGDDSWITHNVNRCMEAMCPSPWRVKDRACVDLGKG